MVATQEKKKEKEGKMVLVPGKRKEEEGEGKENKWSKIILKSKEE